MNAQTLINETPTESQSFGDFSVFFKSPIKSHIVISGGDKFVARTGNIQIPAGDSSKGFNTSPSELTKRPLMPQTDILQQININNCKNTATFKGDVIRSMGIEGL